MLRKISLIFVFVVLPTSVLASNHKSKKYKIETLFENKEVKASKKEIYAGKLLAEFYHDFRRDRLNSKKIKNIINYTKKVSLFKNYASWPRQVYKILKQKSKNGIRGICHQLVTNKLYPKTLPQLTNKSLHYCYERYLEKVSSIYFKRKLLNKYDWSFLKNNLDKLSSYHYSTLLGKIIEKLEKKSPREFKKISILIADHNMEKSQVPHHAILKKMYFPANFTKYLQVKGIEDSEITKLYYKELRNKVSKIYDEIDDNNSEESVNHMVQGLVEFYEINQDKLPANASTDKLSRLAKFLTRNNHANFARLLLETISKYVNDIELKYDYIWTYIYKYQYKKALLAAKKLKIDTRLRQIDHPKIIYWIGRSQKELNYHDYKFTYTLLIDRFPLSFYSIKAAQELFINNDKAYEHYTKILDEKLSDKNENSKVVLKEDDLEVIKRLRIWSKVDIASFLKIEKKEIYKRLSKNSQIGNSDIAHSLLVSLFTEENNHLEAFKVTYAAINNREINPSFKLLSKIFPGPFDETIKKYRRGVDAVLIKSLMRQESSFNPRARSHVGAVGLMQLMPSTARTISRSISSTQLMKPRKNIMIGVKFLKKLLEKYNYNLVYTLSAYNAGPSRVKRWQRRYFTHDSLLHNIESIPFDETRKYVKLIMRNMFFYRLLENVKH